MFILENPAFTIPEAPICGFIEDADLKSVPFSGTTCVRSGPHALQVVVPDNLALELNMKLLVQFSVDSPIEVLTSDLTVYTMKRYSGDIIEAGFFPDAVTSVVPKPKDTAFQAHLSFGLNIADLDKFPKPISIYKSTQESYYYNTMKLTMRSKKSYSDDSEAGLSVLVNMGDPLFFKPILGNTANTIPPLLGKSIICQRLLENNIQYIHCRNVGALKPNEEFFIYIRFAIEHEYADESLPPHFADISIRNSNNILL